MTVAQLDKLTAVDRGLGLCWLGNDGWLIAGGGRIIAFDLDLGAEGLRLAPSPVAARDIASRLDAHFISHEHEDHFNTPTCQTLAEEGDCTFVIPANTVRKARAIGIPDERIVVAVPGEKVGLDWIEASALRALHGHRDFAIFEGANMQDCGYLLEMAGKRILQPGDSVLLSEHLALGHVDVLFVSPTVHNMHVDRSLTLIEALQPDYIFPQHYGTYRRTERNEFWTKGYPAELREALPEGLAARYHMLPQGEVFRLS